MDILGSIDVRDLLSSSSSSSSGGDLDLSSPLSAPDLRLLIDRLEIRAISIKSRVRDYAALHRSDFASLFSRCAASSSKSSAAASALSAALRPLSRRPIDLEIRALADEIAAKTKELNERRTALTLVEAITAVHNRIELARESLNAGKVVEAAEIVKSLKEEGIDLVSKEGDGEPAVYEALRKEWSDCFDQLQEVLARNAQQAVNFEVSDGRVTVQCWSRIGEENGIEFHRVLDAMELVDVLDYGLAKVADSMLRHVMVPLINSGYSVSSEVLNEHAEQMPASILCLVAPSEFQECRDGAALYSRILEVIRFIHKVICFQNSKWMQCFGRLTWGRLSDLIISSFLSKVIPHDALKAGDFESTIRATSKFEALLKEMMFISKTDSKDEKLTHFVHNVEVLFACRKKNEILAKARKILVQSDFTIPQEKASNISSQAAHVAAGSSSYVTDLLFQGETCLISGAASQLMALVHETLKDACLSSTRVAKEFYHAARDALLLYEAIVPIKLGRHLDSISQVAVIIHNDCIYLAQEILGLAFEYRVDFPRGLREQAVFLDLWPKFCHVAQGILQKQMQLVRTSLQEAIDCANGFQNTHQSQQNDLAKFSMEQVVFVLEKVRIIWEPLLPPSSYKKAMHILLDFVFSEITKDLLLLDDMAAEETLQLQRLIQIMLENLSPLLVSLLSGIDEKEKCSRDNDWTVLDEKIPSLRKLRKLADLFDMPLRSIMEKWESRELVNCGFTLPEVENFVKAVFADSPLRKECLWRIRNTD